MKGAYMPDDRHLFTDTGCRAPGEGLSGAIPLPDWGDTMPDVNAAEIAA